jgi:hypothetical protein
MSAQPEVCETARELYDSLGCFTAEDEANDWHLLLFCDALTSVITERIHEIAADRNGRPGWQTVFDPDTCPPYALPYLGQFVGVALEPALTEAEQRAKITVPEGWQRGTTAAMISAVRRTLTDTQTVIFQERYPDNAYNLSVRTLAEETPDEAATLRAILTQKPIGIKLNYEAITSGTWDDLAANYANWDAVSAAFTSWEELATTLP